MSGSVSEVNEGEGSDALLEALDQVRAVLHELAHRADVMIAEADRVSARRATVGSWEQVLFAEGARRLTSTLADSAIALGRVNSAWRQAQAAALHARGVPMARIGGLLGVTRQRVAVLLGRETVSG